MDAIDFMKLSRRFPGPIGQALLWQYIIAFVKRHPLAMLMALATTLRLYALGSAPLWYDEAGAVWMASLPLVRLIAATAGDVHPPLFFLIIKSLFAVFGPNPWAMRLPSAFFGVAALPLVFSIGERIGLSERTRLLAIGLMAISPFELWYSQEARMYALLQFCVLGMVWAGLNHRWSWYVLAATAGMYAQNFGVIYWAVFAVVLIGREFLKPLYTVDWYELLFILVTPAILFLPWAGVILSQLHNYAADWIPQVTPGGFLQPLIEYWWPGSMTNGFYLAVALGAMLLTIFAFGQVAQRPDRAGLFLVFMVIAPLAGAAAFSLAWKPIYISRPFIAGAPFLYLLVAQAMMRMTRPARLVAALLPLVLLTTGAYYPDSYKGKETNLPAASVMSIIRSNWLPGDIIYHGNVGTMLPIWPLTWNTSEPQYLMPAVGFSAGMLRPATRQAMGMREIPLKELTWGRAWLVWSAGPTIDPIEDTYIQAMLAAYPHEQFLSFRNGYADFGLWLLHHPGTPAAAGN